MALALVAAWLRAQTSAHVTKATERLRAGDLTTAESEFRAAIESGASDAEAYSLLGLICNRTNRLDEALCTTGGLST